LTPCNHRIYKVLVIGILSYSHRMATVNQKLAKRIKDLRTEHNLTQEKLAELSGVDYKHIQLLESSRAPSAKLDTLEKIAKAFKITPSKLINF
jgi:DNA-binding Xre family transcriptional regulator